MNEMEYDILGSDESTEEQKLEKYTGVVEWSYLQKHYENGALLYVDPTVPLIEVGKALTDDDAEKVKRWRKSGEIVTPSTPHAFYWEESKAQFRALVVSPFVLIQPLESETE